MSNNQANKGRVIRFARPALSETEQRELAQSLRDDFDIQVERWDEKTGEPLLEMSDLQLLTQRLCDRLRSDESEIIRLTDQEAVAQAVLRPHAGMGSDIYRQAVCLLGEQVGVDENGQPDYVTDKQRALNIAFGRAYRAALRGFGFTPLDAYRRWKQGQAPDTDQEFNDGNTMRRERGRYEALLAALFGPEIKTSIQLTDAQLSYLVSLLRADRNLRPNELRAAA